ncbi:MAG: GNAT family N-acetyltransferase [Anaerolineales bacterium]|nr:GNAT family N-acetyltransferase [Anaerolineales bacterium]
MPQPYQTQREDLTLSCDPARLDLEAIAGLLAHSYWAPHRTRAQITRTLQHSLAFGVYTADNRQVGFARVVSDYTTFAWLCDVIVHEDFRGQGIGKWLMASILSHPDLHGLKRILLATRDAHGLYSQFGFTPLNEPDRWMERFHPEA